MNAKAKQPRHWAGTASKWATRVVLACITFVMLFSVAWNVYSSFKTNEEFIGNPFSLPKGLEWGNYVRAFEKSNLGDNLLNSVFVVIVSLAVVIVCVIPCSYCLARFRFVGSRAMTTFYMAAIFIQATYIMAPLFLQMNALGLTEKLTPVAVLYAVTQFPFSIFLLTGFMRSIPLAYEEAAMMDGCGHFKTLLSVIAPMAMPGVVTVCMLAAMAAWNEYPIALVMLTSPNKQTLPVGLAQLYEVQRYATDWGALFAALVMVLVPTIGIYAVGQKYLIQGINVGGVKG